MTHRQSSRRVVTLLFFGKVGENYKKINCIFSWKCFDRCDGADAVIDKLIFASFGTPSGSCLENNLQMNKTCHAKSAYRVVEDTCIGHQICTLQPTDAMYGDPCPGLVIHLYIAFRMHLRKKQVLQSHWLSLCNVQVGQTHPTYHSRMATDKQKTQCR